MVLGINTLGFPEDLHGYIFIHTCMLCIYLYVVTGINKVQFNSRTLLIHFSLDIVHPPRGSCYSFLSLTVLVQSAIQCLSSYEDKSRFPCDIQTVE